MGFEQIGKFGPSTSNLNALQTLLGLNKTGKAGEVGKTTASKPIEIVNKDITTRNDLSSTVSDISNRARINSPAAQGLASAQEVEQGQLVSGYHFGDLGSINKYDAKLFALKYNSANTPSIANGTNYACEGIEYAGVAANIEAAAKKSPFAELFA